MIAMATTGRSARRPREKKGLPEDAALEELAVTYLDIQHRLWPELVGPGVLPAVNDNNARRRLAADFKQHFMGGSAGRGFSVAVFAAPWKRLAAVYLRYSDDNSNPRSLDQQLRNILERAHRDGAFVPWPWVCADAAITGTIAARRGYVMAKTLMEAQDGPTFLYLDDIGRAARTSIESLRLGNLIVNVDKHMIGVTDGFDTRQPYWKMMLNVYAMLNEWFIDQLRAKVYRGMADAFLAGRNIQPPALGQKLTPTLGPDGQPMYKQNGKVLMAKVKDDVEAQHVEEAAVLFANERWSPDRIARKFNALKVDGRESWDRGLVMQLLTRSSYRGIEYYRKTRQVRDPETGKVTVKLLPREQWLSRTVPHLSIGHAELWEAVDRRIADVSDAHSRRKSSGTTRASAYPKTLFRPLCSDCGLELALGRSGKHAAFCCLRGRGRKLGCGLTTYKSVKVVEEVLLAHLLEVVANDSFLNRLVAAANEFLSSEAVKPPEDVKPRLAEIQKIKGIVARLGKAVESAENTDVDSLVKRLQVHERRLRQLQEEVAKARSHDVVPPPLGAQDVALMLEDVRGLLNADVAVAAPLLAELTGPILVKQRGVKVKNRTPWEATFTVNAVPVLAKLAAGRNCPTARFWEYLLARGWTMPEPVVLQIEYRPVRQRIAAAALKMARAGASANAIAALTNANWTDVRSALESDSAQEELAVPTRRPRGERSQCKYVKHAAEVARLREQGMSFPKIAARLEIHLNTVTRAYDYFYKATRETAAEEAIPQRRGKLENPHREQIARLRKQGKRTREIAEQVGCGRNTVIRVCRAIKQAG